MYTRVYGCVWEAVRCVSFRCIQVHSALELCGWRVDVGVNEGVGVWGLWVCACYLLQVAAQRQRQDNSVGNVGAAWMLKSVLRVCVVRGCGCVGSVGVCMLPASGSCTAPTRQWEVSYPQVGDCCGIPDFVLKEDVLVFNVVTACWSLYRLTLIVLNCINKCLLQTPARGPQAPRPVPGSIY